MSMVTRKGLRRYKASDELPVVFDTDELYPVFSVEIAAKAGPHTRSVSVETLRRWAKVEEDWVAVQEELREESERTP